MTRQWWSNVCVDILVSNVWCDDSGIVSVSNVDVMKHQTPYSQGPTTVQRMTASTSRVKTSRNIERRSSRLLHSSLSVVLEGWKELRVFEQKKIHKRFWCRRRNTSLERETLWPIWCIWNESKGEFQERIEIICAKAIVITTFSSIGPKGQKDECDLCKLQPHYSRASLKTGKQANHLHSLILNFLWGGLTPYLIYLDNSAVCPSYLHQL